MTKTGLTILLVFYHVDPSDVRNQMEILAEAFPKHEKDPKINIKDVQAWKAALKEVGNISGWHVNDRYYLFLQSIFVQIISINFEILYSLKLFTSPRLTFNMKNFSFFFLSNRIKETFSFSSKNLVHSLRHSSLLLNYSMWINKDTDLVINPHSISDSSQRSFPSCSWPLISHFKCLPPFSSKCLILPYVSYSVTRLRSSPWSGQLCLEIYFFLEGILDIYLININ